MAETHGCFGILDSSSHKQLTFHLTVAKTKKLGSSIAFCKHSAAYLSTVTIGFTLS